MEVLIRIIICLVFIFGLWSSVPRTARADLEDIEETEIPEDEPFLLKEQKKIKSSESTDKQNKPVLKQDKNKELVPPTVNERGRPDKSVSDSKKKNNNKVQSTRNRGQNKAQLKWEASSLKADRNNKYIDLKKDVKLTQGDLLITSDEAVIYFDDNSQVLRAEASGNVFIKKGTGKEQLSAKSGKAVFYVRKRKILLTQNPIVWKQIDVIRGNSISYDVDTGMVTVSKVEGILESKMKEGK